MLHLAKGGNQHPCKLLSPEHLESCYKPSILRFASPTGVHLRLAVESDLEKGSDSTIKFSLANTSTMGKLTDGKGLVSSAEVRLLPAQGCEIRLIPFYDSGIKEKAAHCVDLVLSLDFMEVQRWRIQIFHPHYGPRIFRLISGKPGYRPASRAFFRDTNGAWCEKHLLPDFDSSMSCFDMLPGSVIVGEWGSPFALHTTQPDALALPPSLQTATKETLARAKRGFDAASVALRLQKREALREKNILAEREVREAKHARMHISKNRPQRRRHGFCLAQYPSMIPALQLLTEEYYRKQALRQSARLRRKSGAVKTEMLGSIVAEEEAERSSLLNIAGDQGIETDHGRASTIWPEELSAINADDLSSAITPQMVQELMPASLAPTVNWRAGEFLEDRVDAALFNPRHFSPVESNA